MRVRILCALFLFFSSFAFAEVAIESETKYVNLVKGVYKDVKFPDLPDKSIFKFENKRFQKYVDLILDNDRKVIRFKPKRKGAVTIRLINRKDPDLILKQIVVNIQKDDLDQIAKEVKELLTEIEGIEIKIINNKVVVDGYILLAKDMNRIAMVLSQYKGKVSSLVRLSPLTKRKIAERIEAEIDNPNIYVTVINDFYMLEGAESYAGERERSEKIAQAHISDTLSKFAVNNATDGVTIQPVVKTPNPIINNILPVRPREEPEKKMIQVVVHYVELSKSYSRGFSFSWLPSINAEASSITISGDDNSNSNIFSSLTATISNLLPKLNWAREHGHARVLDTMNIITEEGKKGDVSSSKTINRVQTTPQGGVVPVPLTASVSTSVTPRLDPAKRDKVSLEINIRIQEISEISGNRDQQVSNSISTNVTIRNKQSAALGGLLRSTSSTGYNRAPAGAGDTLFRLVASKDLARAQSQFVIFATPVIKTNASQGMDKVKRKFRLDK